MPKPEDWSVASDIGGAWGESPYRKGEGRALVSLGEHGNLHHHSSRASAVTFLVQLS